jgi:hypothetical protein
MRIVNLSSGGDPFLSSFVIKLWKERWYDEVDRFIVNFNNNANVPQEVVSDFLSTVSKEPKIDIIYHPTGCGNGVPIKEGTLISPKDSLIMLLEDDGFWFTPGLIDTYFKMIENGECDAIGSPRESCGKEVSEALRIKYNLDYSGVGDQGGNYWPNFFFTKREDLLKTDLNFASKHFPKGEYFKELDHTFVEDNYGDTFVWADIQMRYNGVRFFDIPQNHTYPEDFLQNEKMYLWESYPKYIHGGSLSSGWGGYLNKKLPPVDTDMTKKDIETRVAWWMICSNETEGYEDFKKEYKKGIQNLIEGCALNMERIMKKYNGYRKIMGI